MGSQWRRGGGWGGGQLLTRVFSQRRNHEGYFCQSIGVVQDPLLPVEHGAAGVLRSRGFLCEMRPEHIDSMTAGSKHAGVLLRSCSQTLPVCCASLPSEQELRDQLVSRWPVHPGWRPTSTGQPKDSRNSRKCGWTLDEDSTFLKI